MKKFISITKILVLVLLYSLQADAQQDPMFTKYMFNSLIYNPGYAGSHEYMSINAIYRNQWYGWNQGLEKGKGGAPVSQTLTVHSPVSERVGLGLNLINDKIGASSTTAAYAAYAYRIPFGEGKISLGLQAGVKYWRADWSQLNYKDPQATDPSFAGNNWSQWIPNVGAGVYYYAEKFYLGFGVPHLIEFDINKNDNGLPQNGKGAKWYRHYYLSSGAAIPIKHNENLVFKPSLLIKSVGFLSNFATQGDEVKPIGAPTEFDIDLSLLFRQTFWIGTSFRSSFEAVFSDKSSYDSGDIWMALYLKNGVRIGAAYDYSLTRIQNHSIGSFEVMLGYDFNYEIDKINTPRYF